MSELETHPYILLYLFFQIKTASLAGVLNVVIFATILLLGQLLLHGQMRINVIGFVTAVVTMKSIEYMPFFLSFFLFLNGSVWIFYALLVGKFSIIKYSILIIY
uniref:Uncharacterized protein n=1 Tax=Solanum lycopersicum TaxID=4081 RepID=A0A3Q7ENN0_SOLLC